MESILLAYAILAHLSTAPNALNVSIITMHAPNVRLATVSTQPDNVLLVQLSTQIAICALLTTPDVLNVPLLLASPHQANVKHAQIFSLIAIYV